MLKKWILMHFTKYCSNKESWFGLMCTHLICYHNDLWTINKKWQFFKDESVSETCILLIVSRIDSMNFLLRDIKCERNGPLMHLTKYSTIKESWFGLMNTHSVFYYAHFFFFCSGPWKISLFIVSPCGGNAAEDVGYIWWRVTSTTCGSQSWSGWCSAYTLSI